VLIAFFVMLLFDGMSWQHPWLRTELASVRCSLG